MLKELIHSKYKWERCGGPLTKKVLDQQPPKKEHIEHLEKRFDMEWVRPPKVFYNFREAHSLFVDELAKKPASDVEPASEVVIDQRAKSQEKPTSKSPQEKDQKS